jgi:hypothetical protein
VIPPADPCQLCGLTIAEAMPCPCELGRTECPVRLAGRGAGICAGCYSVVAANATDRARSRELERAA